MATVVGTASILPRRLLQQFTTIDANSTFTTDWFSCDGGQRLVVTISAVEGVDGRTIAPEIQFCPTANGFSTGTTAATASTGAVLNHWGTAADEVPMNFTFTSITASGSAFCNVPIFGPLVRVSFTVTGAAGDFTIMTATIMLIG